MLNEIRVACEVPKLRGPWRLLVEEPHSGFPAAVAAKLSGDVARRADAIPTKEEEEGVDILD